MLGFKYDEREEALEVQVHRAKDLVVADHSANSTDPYVIDSLQNYCTSEGDSNQRKKLFQRHLAIVLWAE